MQDLTQSNSSDIPQSRFNWENSIAAIALQIRASLDLPTILQTTADEVHQLLGSDRVLLYQFSPDWGGQVVVESVSEPRWSLLDRVVRDTCFEACWIEHYQEGKYASISNVATANLSSCYADFLNNFEIKANLVVPLLCESQLWGLLIAHHCSAPHQWQSEEISGLQQIAFHIGIAIYQASLLDQWQSAKANLEAQVAERTVELEQANQQLLGRMDECSQKVNELERHKSQLSQLAVIVESSQDAIISKTLDGIITSWNQAAESLFGYKAEEIIGKNVTELIPQERQFEETFICQKIYQGQRVDTYETQRKHQDGTLLDVALTISPIKDENGTVIGASKIARDISGRKRLESERTQAEKELRQSKEQLEDFFENVSDLIQSVSLKDGRFLFVNRAWQEVLGYSPEEIADLNMFEMLAPECMPACQVLFQKLQRGEILAVDRAEFIFLAKDGQKVFLEGNINVRQEDGISVATRTILRDVTALRQTEYILNEQTATLQSFYDSAPLMMGVVELSENDILHISDNLATIKFFNLSPDEIIGKWSSELGVPSEHIDFWCNHYRISQEIQMPVQFEYEHVTEMATFHLLVTVSFIDISDSQRPRFCYVAQDISDRKLAELVLQQSEATNRALIEAIPDFLVRMNRDGLQMAVINQGSIHAIKCDGEIQGHSITELMPDAIAQERMRLAEIALQTRQTQKQEYEFVDRGQTYFEEARIAPLWDDEVLVVVRDISDRLRAEAELKRLSERLALSLKSGAIGSWEWDINQNIVLWDERMYELYGVTKQSDSVIYDIWVNAVHPDDRTYTETLLQQVFLGQAEYDTEFRVIHPDCSIKFIKAYGVVVRDAQDNPISMIGVNFDISELKQAELDIKFAKNQLELVLQASSEGFWDLNLVTGEIYFSPQWKAILGYEDHELENTLDMWVSMFLKEDQETALKLVEEYKSGNVDRFISTQRCRHKNGSTVYVLSRAIHLKDEQGIVTRMIGSHLDMTQLVEIQNALKISEMQLSGILSSSLDGIMALQSVRDEQGVIIDFEWLLINPTAESIVGRQDKDLIGKRLLEEMPGNRESGLFDLYVKVVETGESIQQQFYYNHDGIDCWFENIAVKLGDGFTVTFRNITAMKQSELAIQQANQQLEERVTDLNQRHAEMLALSEISDFLQASLTVEEACITLSQLVEKLFPNCAGGIFITSASRNRVELISTWGESLQSEDAFLPKDCWALRRGRIHVVETDRAGLRCNHIHSHEAISATLCIPMIAQGETLGMFYLDTNNPNALPEVKQQLARTLAEQVAMAIANLRLQETLQQQSIRDPLTGLFNRRYLEENLNQEISRAQRQQHQIGVIMIDIDHFKRFNDTYGHDAGDYVLQTVGTLLKKYVRGSDVACRYGGEEMILVLPDLKLEAVSMRAEEIREAIAQVSLSHNSQLLGSLTASFGVASFPQHGATGSAVMQAADAALYRAKAAGRNQVLTAP
ncbi:MAG: PleD-like protein [Pseudanabaena frigida]|uniref:PleD-like protein n=1 Tax=Pseudanabaena frigida TaxID=945775 RepID=A0A2W4WFV6_9CYAN|nr:MAG: PleD-like protein [Pseudanabaena frigida]